MPNLSYYTMQVPIQHMYKPSHEGNGLLYAWFLSMHTRVDIILYSQKTERELLLVVNRIYDALCRLEKMATFMIRPANCLLSTELLRLHQLFLAKNSIQ